MEVKTYTTIFDRAKAAYGTGAYDDATLEFIFPELAESEDERIRKVLIHIVKSACSKYGIKYIGDKITEEMLLAYIERQKEQKSVENSGKELLYVSNKSYNIGYRDGKREAESKQELCEEDEAHRDFILELLEDQIRFFKKDEEGEHCVKQIRIAQRWLKSLRPSWKPSDEQMEVLRRASTNEYVSEEQFDILVSLYEQLKKL